LLTAVIHKHPKKNGFYGLSYSARLSTCSAEPANTG
jgi:hypothetical protein